MSYVRGMLRWVARLCVGLASMVLLWPNEVRAIALAPRILTNGPEIPVDGVLKVHDQAGTIVVRDAEGNAVPGQLVAPGVWRPDAPFVPGVYEVGLADVSAANWTSPFQAVPTPAAADDFVSIALSTDVGLGEVTRLACCGKDLELSQQVSCTLLVFDPCPPEPYCTPVAYQKSLSAFVSVEYSDPDSPLAGQFDIMTAVSSELELGGNEVDPAATEYCATLDVHNWVDGSTYQIADCLAHAPEMLGESAGPPTYLGTIAECVLPPDGYTGEWCELMRYECVDLVTQLSDPERQTQVALCQHYRELCEPASMEPPPAATSPATAPAGTSPAGDENGSLRGVSEDQGGCSVVIHRAASRGSGGLEWFALCLGAAWRFARKVQVRLGKSPTAGTSAKVCCR
jgi:hypothetical protein